MGAIRKIQISATAVIINGVLALSGILPGPALANPCATIYICWLTEHCPPPSAQNTICQAHAPTGCTVTAMECPVFICSNPPDVVAIECDFE